MEQTATAIAAAVHSGTLTARTAVEQALHRIEQTQPAFNAWQVIRHEAALAEADAIDARDDRRSLPLAGVPIAIKDNIAVAGEPMREGSPASNAAPQPTDHEVVRRLRAAGAVVVGLTRVPELCIWGATDSAFGVTRNPWNPQRTPGGSSGGSAAAVASGAVPVAHGNDGMGSIRIPAACCGLVGLKPGHGVVPVGAPHSGWGGMSENGPIATTVDDAALMFSVMADDPDAATVIQPTALRIAVSTSAPSLATPVARAWAEAVHRTGDLLRGRHLVRSATPRYPANLMTTTALALWTAGAAADAHASTEVTLLERRNRVHVRIGDAVEKRGLANPTGREVWRRRAFDFFADTDVLITPTLAQPPIKSRRWGERGWLTSLIANARYAPFAAPWNIIGWPAMNVPAGLDAHGQPVCVQLVGRPGSERTLLGLAATIEQVRPWPRTAPADALRPLR
ncbi:amidase [[Mycobacterium] vasticus]|uniref:amidase n=1 Tax=[Mycobacterium] vasticus TaxID=2875777 RepID=A0ABU5Z470_9MYCO|nr:amidase family protein [Mycolicibacter sp. MYC017]MEB3071945.1 amidase family protein [Mycolicibacter sp. MYC017]